MNLIAFEIVVNGEKIVLAGVGDSGVLSSIVSWGSEHTANKGNTTLSVGGAESPATHVNWIRRNLVVGDTVEIRIVERNEVDEPQLRKSAPRPDSTQERDFKIVK